MPSKSKRADVLIVGAGAAGLAAARDVSVAGRKVFVLEGRRRIGGRIFTHQDPAAAIPIELGAEFVHGKSPALWHLAERAHLKLQETSERHWYFERGQLSKSRDFWKKIDQLNQQMKSSDGDQSFKDFLASLPDDEETHRAKEMAIRYVEGFHAANIERIGIHGLIKANEAAEEIEGDQMFHFPDGYDSLVQALQAEAESYGATIYLNTIVKEIHWNGERVEAVCVRFDGENSFAASCAIITLPLAVLQTNKDERAVVRFVPELPHEKLAAISDLTMGNALRIVLRFRERFWEGLKLWDGDGNPLKFAKAAFMHYPEAPIPTWWTQLPLRAPVLVGWAGGPRADSLLAKEPLAVASGLSSSAQRTLENSPAIQHWDRELLSRTEPAKRAADLEPPWEASSEILDPAIASIAVIFNISPETVRDKLEASYFHDWRQDPFSRGAYSYVPVNGLDAQQILSQPIDNRLFFAGEATSIGHIGTVHGAIQSGQRAAREALAS